MNPPDGAAEGQQGPRNIPPPDSLAWSVIIPAWNEELRIVPTLGEIATYFRHRRVRFEIILVDDGSTDRTVPVVEAVRDQLPELRVIEHPMNRGKGAAVRTGMLAAKGALRLFLDADGSTPIREVERLEAQLPLGAQVVIGSRAMPDPDVTLMARWHRRLLGRLFNAAVNLIVVPGIRDTQCGFKLFTAAAADALFPTLRMDGFSFDLELLFLARSRGLPIKEVAVDWQHRSGSKVCLLTDGPRMLLDAIRIRLRGTS